MDEPKLPPSVNPTSTSTARFVWADALHRVLDRPEQLPLTECRINLGRRRRRAEAAAVVQLDREQTAAGAAPPDPRCPHGRGRRPHSPDTSPAAAIARRPRTAHGSPGTPPPPSLDAPDSSPEDAPSVAGCRSSLHRHALDVVRQNSRRREYTMTCSASRPRSSPPTAPCTRDCTARLEHGSRSVTGWTTRTRRSPETRCA